MLHEQLQQQELGLREFDQAAAPVDLVRDRVQHEVAEAQNLRGVAVVAGATEQRPQPGLQLTQGERFDEVVIGAGLEAVDAVVDRVAGGQHQDRRAVARGAHPAAHLETVDLRHHHIEDHRIGGAALGAGLASRPHARPRASFDVVAVELQRSLERSPDGGLVVYHKDAASGTHPLASPSVTGKREERYRFGGPFFAPL